MLFPASLTLLIIILITEHSLCKDSEAPAHAWHQTQTMCSSSVECCWYTLKCFKQTEAAPVECHHWGWHSLSSQQVFSAEPHSAEPRHPRWRSQSFCSLRGPGRRWECRQLRVHLGTAAVLAAFSSSISFIPPINPELWALLVTFYWQEIWDSNISYQFNTHKLWWLIWRVSLAGSWSVQIVG